MTEAERPALPSENPLAAHLSKLPRRTGIRWYVKRGSSTYFERGFHNKAQANEWLNKLPLFWRVGWAFQLYGDDKQCEIVNIRREQPKGMR